MRYSKLLSLFFVTLLSITMLMIPYSSQVEAHECRVENVQRTFIQLWNKDSQRSVAEWEKQFSQLKSIGFSEVILQWSSYGWIDRPTEDFKSDPLLRNVFAQYY